MRLYMHPILTAAAIALITSVGFISSVIDSFSPPIERAQDAMESGNYEKAGKELSLIISGEPDNYTALLMRTVCYQHEETYNGALEDLKSAEKIIVNSKKNAEEKEELLQSITNHRSDIYIDMKRYPDAIKVYKTRLTVVKNPDMRNESNNNIAWQLSTLPGSTKESGKEAIKYATDACKYSNYKNPAQLDTLAAAYARAGNMQAAIKWQREVIKIMKEEYDADDEDVAEMKGRLKLYVNGKTYTVEPDK